MTDVLQGFTLGNITLWAARLMILFGSIVLHEISHGYVAFLMGDSTAKYSGRLSLNPLKHVDPFGTVIMPALMLLLSGGSFAFGYAKPVPINPSNFRNERKGMLITGIAGPATNIVLAIVTGLLARVIISLDSTSSTFLLVVVSLLYYAALMNLILAFFNLIPIPPLDGSRVLQRFLPTRVRDMYHGLEPYGFIIVIGISYLFPSVFNGYLSITALPLLKLLVGI